jgi:hypothetical protein
MAGWQRLPFAMQYQEQGNWCWAAVATSVARFFNSRTTRTQCNIADAELKRTDCCGAGAGGACNVYGYLASALNRVGHLKAWRPSGAATPAELKTEIDNGRPLCLRVAWASGGAHFLAVVGYLPGSAQLTGSDLVAVEDSRWGSSNVPYDVLRESYRLDGRWTDSYFTRKRRGHPAAS